MLNPFVKEKAMTTETGPDHFGDIMSANETWIQLPEIFSPMERVVLTANGNLQRILSSYFNSPVSIQLCYNQKVESKKDSLESFKRCVDLICKGKPMCRAISSIDICSQEMLSLITNDQVGIGQLFRQV